MVRVWNENPKDSPNPYEEPVLCEPRLNALY